MPSQTQRPVGTTPCPGDVLEGHIGAQGGKAPRLDCGSGCTLDVPEERNGRLEGEPHVCASEPGKLVKSTPPAGSPLGTLPRSHRAARLHPAWSWQLPVHRDLMVAPPPPTLLPGLFLHLLFLRSRPPTLPLFLLP